MFLMHLCVVQEIIFKMNRKNLVAGSYTPQNIPTEIMKVIYENQPIFRFHQSTLNFMEWHVVYSLGLCSQRLKI